MRYQENLMTLRWRRDKTASLAARVTDLYAIGGDEQDADAEARRLLAEIELHLTAGHERYHEGRYWDAIDEYRTAQTLIFQLLDSRLPRRTAHRRDVRYPQRRDLFEPLLRAGLELVEAIGPRRSESSFGGVLTRVPAAALDSLQRFRQQGVQLADAEVRDVAHSSELAADYIERGQWERAHELLERARRDLAGADSPAAREALGALDLTTAAVLIQMERFDEAQERLQRADVAFRVGGDHAGRAQVELNRAALHARRGEREEAGTAAQRARRLLQRAGAVSAAADGPGSPEPDGGPSPRLITRAAATGRAVARRRGSLSLRKLSAAAAAGGSAVTYRLPGRGGGWGVQALAGASDARERDVVKSLTLLLGEETITVRWRVGEGPPLGELVERYFRRHAAAEELTGLIGSPGSDAELAVQLPHLFLFVIPVAMADCLHELGDYAAAEDLYLKAADYEFINVEIEVPALWLKLAENVLAWGDDRYRREDFPAALDVYRKVVEPPGAATAVPEAAPLYSHPQLGLVGAVVESLYEGTIAPDDEALNPQLAAVVLEIRARVLQLHGGLDFLGLPTNFVPIWSFEFLQGVARYFAQQAVQAEREFVRFLDRAENESMTLLQLEQGKEISAAERMLSVAQRQAAEAERDVFNRGVELAHQRAENAKVDRDEFKEMTEARIDYDYEINTEVHDIDMAFLYTWRDQAVLQYELAARDRQIQELEMAKDVAVAQLESAQAQVEVTQQMEIVAGLKYKAASEQLAAFNSQFFTPDVWNRMASFMRSIARSYLRMATRAARMMERAYAFEYDDDWRVIRADYVAEGVGGLLGADLLLLDVDSFTQNLLDTVRRKRIPVKQSISLAGRYPFHFESQLKQTGRMEFETRLMDFDLDYPGTYSRRLERVEVEVDGVVPESGIHGTLTNAGISLFRTATGDLKFRIQNRETALLSEYRIRNDSLVFPSDGKALALFEGAGVAGTWSLEIPRASNDLDFRTVTDVRLVFYYSAFYDPLLEEAVVEEIANTPGALSRARKFQLRWTHPDAFYHFLDSGQLGFELTEDDFPANQQAPVLRHVSLRILAAEGADASGWLVRLAVPAHPETVAATLGAGGLASAAPDHPWQPLAEGAAIGEYLIEIRGEDNPGLVTDDALDLGAVDDLLLLLEYEYTPPA